MEKDIFNPQNYTVLIVDDLIQNIQVLATTLEAKGYSITYALSGKEALQRLKAIQPDLILLDLLMPEMSGLEVCEEIRRNSDYSHIPILFLTASHEEEHLLEAFEKGAADYITKPFRTAELLARVQTHIQLKYQTKKLRESENKLNTIVTYIKDGILIVDHDGVVQFVNPAALQMFDKSFDDLLYHELGIPVVVGKVAELDIIRANGVLGKAEITVGDAEWLDKKVSIVSLRDVSERNQIERKLRIALNKQKVLSQKLKKIANTDPLTGIFNRRHILSILQEEFKRNKLYDQTFSLLLVDIDHFKSVNRSYGNPVGDQVLQEITIFLGNCLRSVDMIGRCGGEEFLAVLPGTTLDGALELGESLCSRIRNLKIETRAGFVQVTVSIGVTVYSSEDSNDEVMLKRVDDALYKAKELGRNRCVFN
ncbi:diguanylate cyclase [Anabaena sp. FACHB-1237]|uniref:diguanylate cyclase n=1 Tax=Anabaena sp. FACHB-1237 TaxID=2692769 RepID=UPI001680B400|nr:diguanylate cyclase [Anabaena sp. FACHB-1237]MBD2137303.1 diguanylate cyclase [Anabaena sp. FACHB-1237]